MSTGTLIPTGWIGGRDAIAKMAQVFHRAVEDSPPLTAEASFELASMTLAEAMCCEEPVMAAFVVENGQAFTIPATSWGAALDEHLGGVGPSALGEAFISGTLGNHFREYAGLTFLFDSAHFNGFVRTLIAALSGERETASVGLPWERYRSRSAWLASPSASEYADRALATEGKLATEANRRDLFEKLFEKSRQIMPRASIATVRNRAGYLLTIGLMN